MWFGDLVTMKWWNGIWLNEAFATFMELLAVDAFRPEWQRWVSFGVEREAAMAVDGLHATRPVEFPVGRPEEAEGMFDVLTYQKGGSVLRMLEQYLGPDVFRDGIRDYLTTHRLRQHRDGRPVGRHRGGPAASRCAPIMDTWIFQGGYPAGPGGRATASLAQEPFSYRGEPGRRHRLATGRSRCSSGRCDGRTAWTRVPILLGTGPARRRRPVGAGDPLVNAGGSGFYRVAYPTAVVERLAGRPRRPRPARALQPGLRHLGRRPGRPGPAGRPAPAGRRPRPTRASATRVSGRW